MKYQRPAIFCLLILFATFPSSPQSSAQSKPSERFAEIRISTAKSEYLLGEPVTIERRFTKTGDVQVDGPSDDRHGRLKVFIAKNEGEFQFYVFTGWILPLEGYFGTADHNKTFYTIFFNSAPLPNQLSEPARLAEDRRILTDYAFPEPGDYRIKATLGFMAKRRTDRFASWTVVNSDEISISVKQPEGDDLSVWEIMKADPRIGYFMMEGEAPYRILDTVLAKVDRITSDYPNSYLAGLLRVKAQEHRARRERYKLENEERLKREKQKASSVSKKN